MVTIKSVTKIVATVGIIWSLAKRPVLPLPNSPPNMRKNIVSSLSILIRPAASAIYSTAHILATVVITTKMKNMTRKIYFGKDPMALALTTLLIASSPVPSKSELERQENMSAPLPLKKSPSPLETPSPFSRIPSPYVLPVRPSLQALAVGTPRHPLPRPRARNPIWNFGIKSVMSKTVAVTYERIVLTPPFPGVLEKKTVNLRPPLTSASSRPTTPDSLDYNTLAKYSP